MPIKYETVLGQVDGPLETLPSNSLNLMPFHLDFTGPAPISTYFQPRKVARPEHTKDSEEGASADHITVAAFRGRRVEAHTLDLPRDYMGLVLTVPAQPNEISSSLPLPSQVRSLRQQETLENSSDTDATTTTGGLRRSPRKRVHEEAIVTRAKRRVKSRVMQKFSMDSDSEELSEDESTGDGDTQDQESTKDANAPSEPVVSSEPTDNSAQATTAVETKPMETLTAIVQDESQSSTQVDPTSLGETPQTSVLEPFLEPSESFDQYRNQDDEQVSPESSIVTRTLLPQATFESFTIWSPDGPLDQGRDEYCRSLTEWVTLGQVLHDY